MKNLTKISFILLFTAAFSFRAKAQSNVTANGVVYSVGVESGVSTGNFKKGYGWNIGGSVQADIPIADNLFATINAGYLNFSGKDNINGSKLSARDIHFLPVMAGFKYFVIPNWYVQGDAGAGFTLNKKDLGYTKTAAFLYAPQIGAQFNVGGKNYIDAGIRYEATGRYIRSVENSKLNFFELRIAYAFTSK